MKLSKKRTFHHFISTGATEKSPLYFYINFLTELCVTCVLQDDSEVLGRPGKRRKLSRRKGTAEVGSHVYRNIIEASIHQVYVAHCAGQCIYIYSSYMMYIVPLRQLI